MMHESIGKPCSNPVSVTRVRPMASCETCLELETTAVGSHTWPSTSRNFDVMPNARKITVHISKAHKGRYESNKLGHTWQVLKRQLGSSGGLLAS
eukprot:2690285-Pleurochrysis_carterae.AAC.4